MEDLPVTCSSVAATYKRSLQQTQRQGRDSKGSLFLMTAPRGLAPSGR